MKKIYFFSILLFALSSCQPSSGDTEKTTAEEKQAATTPVKEVKQVSIKCTSAEATTEPASEIEERVKKLSKLKDNYELKEIGVVPTNTSGFYSVFQSINNLDFTRKQLEITDPDELTNMVEKTTYCFVKGTLDHGDKMYARASIEEYLFKSEACATQFEKHLETIQATSHLSEFFGKAPYSIFRIDDKIYYIVSGGFYMEDYHDLIGNAMRG